ncbi:MAG TPA: amidohydrolase family protein [Thermodesulfobacteriota bacterium]|nr:amidohydrolase family protein [Thermodesulfobacteriota bacterium]
MPGPYGPTMIIDCHTHIFPEEVRKGREAFCKKDDGFSSIYRDSKSKMVGVEDLIASMDESGIDRSVICGFPWTQPDLCSFHNQYLMASASRYPNRLIVFISLLFSNPDWSGKELDRALNGGAKGVGEIAFYQDEMTSRDVHSMKPILTQMEKHGVPLLLHTNETIGHSYPGKGRTPLESFYELILSFPKLPIILAHWGGGLPFYELMPEVAKVMTNVYYDTAGSPFLYSGKIYAIARDMVGAEKIFFGTDYPLISPQRYFKELEESSLSKQDQEKILGLNFSRLIEGRIKGKPPLPNCS